MLGIHTKGSCIFYSRVKKWIVPWGMLTVLVTGEFKQKKRRERERKRERESKNRGTISMAQGLPGGSPLPKKHNKINQGATQHEEQPAERELKY